ncbi:hypothetical protein [Nioella nitratireducens]|uniref:hypothetical protein n=1 Tax=Nioella nitratireducens TaxID=1287720 RepID=UPI0008FD016B|nr:hypothetical protein [Nioella nitratireducens]
MHTSQLHRFLVSEQGAVTVDWVVLTAAVTGMALAATSVLDEGIGTLASNLDAQLRSQQVSDAFVQFNSSHFNALYDAGIVTEADAQGFFDTANQMTNATILSGLQDGLLAYNDGTLSDADVAMLAAMASVGIQRNIVTAAEVPLVTAY